MVKIYNSIIEMVGKTPLLRLGNLATKYRLNSEFLAKCEMFNPMYSIKDRAALEMIKEQEKKGINENTVFVEATSGNTGIGLAGVCASKGYKLIIVMPENMSQERINLMKHFGAEVILTPAEDGMNGAIAKANILKERNKDVVILNQFENEANPRAHKLTTAMEIIEDTDGDFDVLVACIGTAGTIVGNASVLKTYNKDLYVVGVEPEESAVISGGEKGSHKIQGIGAGFVPPLYDKELIDEIVTVKSDDAIEMAKVVARTEGLSVGISAGAAIKAALDLAKREEFINKRFIIILPDSVDRYLSTGYF